MGNDLTGHDFTARDLAGPDFTRHVRCQVADAGYICRVYLLRIREKQLLAVALIVGDCGLAFF